MKLDRLWQCRFGFYIFCFFFLHDREREYNIKQYISRFLLLTTDLSTTGEKVNLRQELTQIPSPSLPHVNHLATASHSMLSTSIHTNGIIFTLHPWNSNNFVAMLHFVSFTETSFSCYLSCHFCFHCTLAADVDLQTEAQQDA